MPLTFVLILLIGGGPKNIANLATEIDQPDLHHLIRLYLFEQLNSGDGWLPDLQNHHRITIFPSVVATFYAPSDISGIHGMRTERIRALPSWRGGPGRYDCIFIRNDTCPASPDSFHDLRIARARVFFSFTFHTVVHCCALVHDFEVVGTEPDEDTGMWVVKPSLDNGRPRGRVLPLDSIYRAVHLIPVYGHLDEMLPKRGISLHNSLDILDNFYVNKYIDHQAFELLTEK